MSGERIRSEIKQTMDRIKELESVIEEEYKNKIKQGNGSTIMMEASIKCVNAAYKELEAADKLCEILSEELN